MLALGVQAVAWVRLGPAEQGTLQLAVAEHLQLAAAAGPMPCPALAAAVRQALCRLLVAAEVPAQCLLE